MTLEPMHMAVTGFYWCLRCGKRTEPADNDHGEVGVRCERCHSHKVEFVPVDLPLARPGPRKQFERVKRVSLDKAAGLFAAMKEAAG